MRQTQVDDAEWHNPANWHVGLYFSRRDSRSFVPKPNPLLGATINFAKPAAYGVLVGIVAFIGLLVWLGLRS